MQDKGRSPAAEVKGDLAKPGPGGRAGRAFRLSVSVVGWEARRQALWACGLCQIYR